MKGCLYDFCLLNDDLYPPCVGDIYFESFMMPPTRSIYLYAFIDLDFTEHKVAATALKDSQNFLRSN